MSEGTSYKEKVSEISESGFCSLNNFFSKEILDSVGEGILDLFLLQARKIDDYREKIFAIKSNENDTKSIFKNLQYILDLMEKNDKEALYQVQSFILESAIVKKIITNELIEFCGLALNSRRSELLFNGPGLFINKPNTQRLLYKWHSEAHYYPKRRRFLNLWIPLFSNKNKENGTMSFKVGSHKKDFPFSQYQGYDKDSQNKSNYFVQNEIPSNLLKDYKEHFCINSPGDLIVFNRSLVHTSNMNISNEYSFALVMRVWNPSDDLTLSGNIAATPYGNDKGRSGLIVSSDF